MVGADKLLAQRRRIDLEEFATTVGINDRIIDILRKHFTEGTAVDEFIYENYVIFIELSWRKIIFLQDNFKNLNNR